MTKKSQRLLHATGAVTAAGGGVFVTMSAEIAALSGAAMINAETPTMQSEVRFMVMVIRRQFTLMGGILCSVSRLRENSKVVLPAFSRIVATE